MHLRLAGGAATFARVARWLARRPGWQVGAPAAEARALVLLDDARRWYTQAGGCLTWEQVPGGARLTLTALVPRGDAVGTWSPVAQTVKGAAAGAWPGLRPLPAGAVRRHCQACGAPLRVAPVGTIAGTEQVVVATHRSGAALELRWSCLQPQAATATTRVASRKRGQLSLTVRAKAGAGLAELQALVQQFPLAAPAGPSAAQAVAQPKLVAPAEPPPVTLRAELSMAAAWRQVVGREVELWAASEAGVRLGMDGEYLHDLRVAIRRLRVGVRLLARALPAAEAVALGTELAWLSQALAAVRDLDVQGNLLAKQWPLLSPAAVAKLPGLQAAWWAERSTARRRLLAALATKRYARLRRRVVKLAADDALSGPDAAAPLGALAGRWLWKLWRKLHTRAELAMVDHHPEHLHDLRITARRLRYAGEWLGGLYDAQLHDFTRAATRLQSVLGRHHDAAVSVAWLKAQGGRRGRRATVRELLALRRAVMRTAEGEFALAWQRVAVLMPPKRYLRAPQWPVPLAPPT